MKKKRKPFFKSKLFLASLCCLFLIVLINACKKNENMNQPLTPAGLISEAKVFFKENTLKDEPLMLNGHNTIQNLKKTPIWEKATVRKISLGDAVIVPIKYSDRMYLKKGGSDELIAIEETTYMMIYDDKNGNKQVERVILMPDESTEKNSKEFIGLIAVEDWQGNFKKGYVVEKGGKINKVKLSDRVSFRKASYLRGSICWTFTWYGQNYSNGNWGDVYVISSDTFCFYYDGDVTEEVDGPEYWQEGGGGSSGGDYIPPSAPAPQPIPTVLDSLNKIMKPSTCLTLSQMQDLATMFGSYLSGQGVANLACIQRAIYKKVEASGKKIGFCVNSGISGNAGYDPVNGNILWKDEAGIPVVSVFSHEFFHAYQDTHYSGGTAQYISGNGFPNIEFEIALFNDIVNGSGDVTGMGSGVSSIVKTEYSQWIYDITNGNTKYPKQFSDFGVDANNVNKYYYFLSQFYQYSPYANVGTAINTMQPSALLNIFSTSNCK